MVDEQADGMMAGEDFAYMLRARPGAFVLMGNGEGPGLHTDTYDFNDAPSRPGSATGRG